MPESRPDHDVPVAAWSDDELIAEFQYLKSQAAQGRADRQPGNASAIEEEMRSRGLQPDRENLIPDDPVSNEAEVKPSH